MNGLEMAYDVGLSSVFDGTGAAEQRRRITNFR